MIHAEARNLQPSRAKHQRSIKERDAEMVRCGTLREIQGPSTKDPKDVSDESRVNAELRRATGYGGKNGNTRAPEHWRTPGRFATM
jgi:hypothetical protein